VKGKSEFFEFPCKVANEPAGRSPERAFHLLPLEFTELADPAVLQDGKGAK
jgi:hypothetical protein